MILVRMEIFVFIIMGVFIFNLFCFVMINLWVDEFCICFVYGGGWCICYNLGIGEGCFMRVVGVIGYDERIVFSDCLVGMILVWLFIGIEL